MSARPRAVVFWSSGKDAAYALHRVRREDALDVAGLVTTVADASCRVAAHGVREKLLDAQARAAGLPLEKIRLPAPCPDDVYEGALAASLGRWRKAGVRYAVFGDLALADVRAWRDERLARLGMEGVYPLWGEDTRALAGAMLRDGLRAVVSCVDLRKLPGSFAGRRFDQELLASLPAGVDPCGENGEFHTFAHCGPMLSWDLPIRVGRVVEQGGFAFADIEPWPGPGQLARPSMAGRAQPVQRATSSPR